MILRQDLDGVITAISGESRGMIGERILAAQLVLNFGKSIGNFGDLEWEEGAAPGGFGDVFQDFVAFIVRAGDIGADGVNDHFSTLRHFDGFFAGYVALIVFTVAQDDKARRVATVRGCLASLSRQAK